MIKTSTFTVLFSLFLHVVNCFGQVTIDPDFKPHLNGGTARLETIAVQPDGKILVGGDFEFADNQVYSKIARFNPDGTLDPSFRIGKGFDRPVHTIALQPDGKILVGGEFSFFNNVPKVSLCRLHPDGSLDAGFTSAPDGNNGSSVQKILVTPSNKILVFGFFGSFNGLGIKNIVQLNPTGDLDHSFQVGAGTNGGILKAVLQQDNKIVLSGLFQFYHGTPVNSICRLQPDGSIDSSFAPDLASNATINAIARQSDNKIIVGGFNLKKNGSDVAKGMIRLNEDGSWDDTFTNNNQLTGIVSSVSLRTDNKILVAGGLSQGNGTCTNFSLVLLNADGRVDLNYTADLMPDGSPWVILSLADNEALMIGYLALAGIHHKAFNLVKLDAEGRNVAALSNAIDLGQAARPHALAVQKDGKIIVSGSFTNIKANEIINIIRLNKDGSPDKDFSVSLTEAYITAIIYQPDGKIILGGRLAIPGKGKYDLVRFNTDGSLDNTFSLQQTGEGIIQCLALQRDGKILVGGNFSQVNGAVRSNLARFNADGTVDPGFNTGSASYSLMNKKVAASTAAAGTEKTSTVAFLAGETGVKPLPNAAASLAITQAAINDGYIQVTAAANPTTTAALPTGVKSLVADNYWKITGVGLEANTIKYTLTLDVTNMRSVSDFNKVTILYRAQGNEPWSDLLASNSTVQKTFQDNHLTLTNLSIFPEIAIGLNSVTGIKDPLNLNFSLQQNYPNPFDKTTTVEYDLKKQAEVVLEVIDAQGKIVKELVHQSQKPGSYKVLLDGPGLKSRSIYFIRLRANGHKSVKTAIYQ